MTPGRTHNGGPPLNDTQDSGWVAVARAMRDHPLVGFHLHATPHNAGRGAMQPALAWIDLVMECRYVAGQVNNNGRVMRLERGQLLGATSWLASRWNWSPKACRYWLEKLEKAGMIELLGETEPDQTVTKQGRLRGRSKGRFANIISICNYGIYQPGSHVQGQVEGQVEGQAEGRLGAGSGQVDIYKERARGNKETREDSCESVKEARARVAEHPDEEHVGHGVYANGVTVRHAGFSISLPAIAMQLVTGNAMRPKAECEALARDAAIAHALQWAAEIENGRAPSSVVPSHMANFISGSILSRLRKGTHPTQTDSDRRNDEAKRRIQAIVGGSTKR